MNIKMIAPSIALIVLCGCTTFSEQSVITAMPNDIKNRNNYLPTAQWKYELTELAGSILVKYKKPVEGRKWDIKDRIVKKNTSPIKEPIDEGTLLTRLVDSRADAKLQAIGIGDASLSSKQKMEFTFSDVRRVFIPRKDWDDSALIKEARKPLLPNEEAKYFIRGALLSVIQRRIYTEVEGTIKNISTTGLKADGNIYNAETNHSKDFAIHLTLRPISDFIEPTPDSFLENTQEIQGLWIEL